MNLLLISVVGIELFAVYTFFNSYISAMEKIKLSIDINAPKQKVWKTLWTESISKKWAAPFEAGTQVIDDWQENSKAHFLGSGGEGLVSSTNKNNAK